MENNSTIHSKQPEQSQEYQGPSSSGHESPTNTTSPPPSSSSSPSHEFSFTISLETTSQTTPPTPASLRGMFSANKAHHPPSIAIDLSPADEIFFHGHLLPLRILSHTSNSPRTSTTSLDNLNLPIRELVDNTHKKLTIDSNQNHTSSHNTGGAKTNTNNANSFSLFGLAKWRKVFAIGNRKDLRKKISIDVGRVMRRYARAVRPILFFRGGEKEKREMRQQPHSFSGVLNSRWKEWGGRRGGEFSAPASMRTSPTNSGLILATATMSSRGDSTMEELQNAIQAAITHCKNSIAAKDDNCRC